MEQIKSSFVYDFNMKNTEQYNGEGRKKIAGWSKYYWNIDNSQAKLVTITEDMLDIEFVENYKNYNIYHITSKIKDGLINVSTTSVSTAPSFTVKVESKVYDNGVYIYLKDTNDVEYSQSLDDLKKFYF